MCPWRGAGLCATATHHATFPRRFSCGSSSRSYSTDPSHPVDAGSNVMQVTRVTSFEDQDELKQAWKQLEAANFCLAWTWLKCWWEYFGQGHELCVLVVRSSGKEIVGIAPWYIDRTSKLSRTIRFLGSGQACSDLMTILCSPGYERHVSQAISQWLTDANHSRFKLSTDLNDDRWDRIDLDGVAEGDSMIERLAQLMLEQASQVMHVPTEGYWRIEHGTDWDQYISRLSRSMRSHVRQCMRKWIDNGKAELKEVTDEASFSRGMEIFVDLHQRRRNMVGDPGCFASEDFAGFLFEVARRLQSEGQLQLWWVEVDQIPVAVQFNIAQGKRVFGYQTGINPDMLHVKAGRVMNIMSIRENQLRGFESLDQMRGDEAYKRQWGSRRIAMVRWRMTSHRISSRLQQQIWWTGRSVKHWLSGKSVSS